ncbi:unnamed protein product [Ceratitis capitata]|uniref:(Mediterranean fruit fly) hypothetical protein n=1 Tax=Ceratitis capitata TaxID=7213 RepID=A0A811UUJ1_CERCA|nr:unnamed protein product [Ceratitis capitata]
MFAELSKSKENSSMDSTVILPQTLTLENSLKEFKNNNKNNTIDNENSSYREDDETECDDNYKDAYAGIEEEQEMRFGRARQRDLTKGEMANVDIVDQLARREQKLEQLRLTYIDLQQRQQQDCDIRDKTLKTVNHLPFFPGRGDVTVNSFFSNVEYLISTLQNELIKDTLKLRYKPDTEPHQI